MTVKSVAVAIVSYKSARLTIDCLRSIEAERSVPGLNIKAIVVDNASGDAPAIEKAIKSSFWSSWVTLVRAPKNGGFAYGNNIAFQSAHDISRPDYFHLLNPDTVVRKGAIAALVRFFETHPEVGIVGSSFENLDGSDWPIVFRFPSILSEIEGGLRLGFATRILRRWAVAIETCAVTQPVDWVSGASMMVRREVFDAVGGFDENYFLYFEETDFCLRARKAGFSTWYVPESRVMHMAGQSTKVTEQNVPLKRLPSYWFESRRRYFLQSYGLGYALGADAAAILANALGLLKLIAKNRRDRWIPHLLADLIHHSAFWPGNRFSTGTTHGMGQRP